MEIDSDFIGVKQAKKFYDDFAGELDAADEVMIDFSRVKRVDLSIVQVIIAAGREARGSGKMIKLKGVSDTIKKQMHICGLKT